MRDERQTRCARAGRKVLEVLLQAVCTWSVASAEISAPPVHVGARCGLYAVDALARVQRPGHIDLRVPTPIVPPSGLSLLDLHHHARSRGLETRVVRRVAGSRALCVPSIVHVPDHYYTILAERDGIYRIADARSPIQQWKTAEAINAEATGYFLVFPAAPAADFVQVPRDHAALVRGRVSGCQPSEHDGSDTRCIRCPCPPGVADGEPPAELGRLSMGACGPAGCERRAAHAPGMPIWRVSEPFINLWLEDVPLTYRPSKGPAIHLRLSYKEGGGEGFAFPDAASVGAHWECDWIGVADAMMNTVPPGTVHIRPPGGGDLYYHFQPGETVSQRHYHDQSWVELLMDLTDLVGIVLHRADGSSLHYGKPDLTYAVYGVRAFHLTEQVDPQGLRLRLHYSGDLLTSITDADGNHTRVYYEDPTLSSHITRVVTPDGFEARLGYDRAGRLTNIVDAVGISSSIGYHHEFLENQVTSLTTPYGTTQFQSGNGSLASDGWIVITEPDGGQHVFMVQDDSPAAMPSHFTPDEVPAHTPLGTLDVDSRDRQNSFYWGPRQVSLLSTTNLDDLTWQDLKLARIRHWLYWQETKEFNHIGNTLALEQAPSPDGQREGQVTWYDHVGKPDPGVQGSQRLPSLRAWVMPDGSTSYIWYQRNPLGYVTNLIEKWVENGADHFRTNSFRFATNHIDLVTHVGPTGEMKEAYVYNSRHQVLRHTNALNQLTEYTYNTDTQLTSIRTPAGLTRTNLYYSRGPGTGRLEKTIDIEIARTNTYSWTNGVVHRHTDERGLSLMHTWDGLHRLRRVDYPDGTFITNGYLWLDLIEHVDRMGFRTLYGYDSMRRLCSVTNALGSVARYEYCTCGSIESETDALGNVTAFTYDLAGHLTKIVRPGGVASALEFDLLGRLVATRDGLGDTTNAYDNLGRLVEVRNALGTVSRNTYNLEDLSTNTVDIHGVRIATTYDRVGRVLTRIHPDGGTEQFGYNQLGLAHSTNQLGQATHYGYDRAGRRVAETNANTEVTRFAYNPAGDLLGLLHGEDQVTTWNYDAFGLPTNKVDANGDEILRLTYDPNGRLTRRWSPEKGTTAYAYDANGNLISVQYPVSPDIAFSYDALNRLTRMMDGTGQTTVQYDSLGQVTSVDGPWVADTVSYSYVNDLRNGLSIEAPNAPAWTQSYAYDTAGRLTNLTSPVGAFVYQRAETTPASPLTKVLDLPGGCYITYAHDASARLLSTALHDAHHATLNSHAYRYNNGDQRVQQVFTTGNFIDYTYDGTGRLKAATGTTADGKRRRRHELWGYAYDESGNLRYRTNNQLIQSFEVNKLNELTSSSRNGMLTVAGTTTGSATNVTVNTSNSTLYGDNMFVSTNHNLADGWNAFTAVAQDQHGRVDVDTMRTYLPGQNTFDYDMNGNLISDGHRIFAYDDENQLVSVMVKDRWKSEFTYDGQMRRRIRREHTWEGTGWRQTNEVRYVYDGTLVIQERNHENLPLITYTRGVDLGGTFDGVGGIGGLLAQSLNARLTSPDAHAVYHTDGNGNITTLINKDGRLLGRYHYDPYGNQIKVGGAEADANVYRFSSKEFHGNSGLIYYLYRYYDPSLHRWLTRDPIGESGGYNLYEFVGGNPISKVDTFGLLGNDPCRYRKFCEQRGGTMRSYADVYWAGDDRGCVRNLTKFWGTRAGKLANGAWLGFETFGVGAVGFGVRAGGAFGATVGGASSGFLDPLPTVSRWEAQALCRKKRCYKDGRFLDTETLGGKPLDLR